MNQPAMSQPWTLLRLPPFPPLALQVMRMVSRDDVSMKELSELIRADQVFASEILMIANSPLYQSRREIDSILQATTLLGLERMKGLTVTVGVRAYLGDWFNMPSLRACWRHSMACALIAEKLAAAAHMDRDTCYTAGWVHDIGRLGLAALHPKPYAGFLQATEKAPCDILTRERELFSCDHCEAGRKLVEAWKLPARLTEVVSRHHEPRGWREDDILSIVHLSCRMADSLGFAAAHNLISPAYAELLAEIPATGRDQFQLKTEEMTLRLAAQINAIENV